MASDYYSLQCSSECNIRLNRTGRASTILCSSMEMQLYLKQNTGRKNESILYIRILAFYSNGFRVWSSVYRLCCSGVCARQRTGSFPYSSWISWRTTAWNFFARHVISLCHFMGKKMNITIPNDVLCYKLEGHPMRYSLLYTMYIIHVHNCTIVYCILYTCAGFQSFSLKLYIALSSSNKCF